MTKSTNYLGIDCFRVIAALLVVAIHTSPLVSFGESCDFLFTHIIARVAVPFFFTTSGFFLVSKYSYNNEKLKIFIKKTVLIYGVSMLLYIPINIYSGYFKEESILPKLIKDIIFDGTFYHLWYLPASIIGATVAWFLVKKFSYTKSFFIALLLYAIGLLGDSYYGFTKGTLWLNDFYNLVFQISDYTRNGIFFAPIFFVVGGYIADKRKVLSLKRSFIGFLFCFTFMILEAQILTFKRHDSMYLFLLPSIYFLFSVLLHFRGRRIEVLRSISLIIYVIHPLVIVLVRLFAKILNLESLLVYNNFVHYILVCIISIMFGGLWNKIKPKKHKYNVIKERAYLEINLNNLEHNVKVLKNAMPHKCELMAVVKAESYGHGMYEIATYLNKIGVKAFAVATIDEGIKLRNYGVSGEILILGYTSPLRARELCKYKLTQTLIDYRYAVLLNKHGYDIKSHIKIDTGMHRLGFDVTSAKEVISTFSMNHIKVTGIFTHLCSADSQEKDDVEFTNLQIKNFYSLLDELKNSGIKIPKLHIQSSYGLLNYPELECDYVRVGIALYGVLSHINDKTKLKLDLKPVLSLKSKVILIRKIKKGESVGYGRTFTATRDSLIAILPIGYADAVPRSLSCKNSYVLIEGQKAEIVGRICMDQLAVDVTDILGVKIGSVATLIGRDGKMEITATMFAKDADTITNELLSRMGKRLNIVCGV